MDEAVEIYAYLDFPAHIIEYSSVVQVEDGWFTHNHEHGHVPDKPGAQHEPDFSHRHEHRWDIPGEHHHHPADPDDQTSETTQADFAGDHGFY